MRVQVWIDQFECDEVDTDELASVVDYAVEQYLRGREDGATYTRYEYHDDCIYVTIS